MARRFVRLEALPRGFPRPRGDGPLTLAGAYASLPVSPPTRGWPLLGGSFMPLFYGFPAHAGMALDNAISADPIRRFPRPRGDGPVMWLAALTR